MVETTVPSRTRALSACGPDGPCGLNGRTEIVAATSLDALMTETNSLPAKRVPGVSVISGGATRSTYLMERELPGGRAQNQLEILDLDRPTEFAMLATRRTGGSLNDRQCYVDAADAVHSEDSHDKPVLIGMVAHVGAAQQAGTWPTEPCARVCRLDLEGRLSTGRNGFGITMPA